MNGGLADTTAVELFKAGGNGCEADEDDVKVFIEAGLIPNVRMSHAAESDLTNGT
ncbi:MAG: hypothetical protein H0X34_17685 [Chthoniobacterales bacterium]|nr:hypothetical protein [Chthoniobacterales bacterium]